MTIVHFEEFWNVDPSESRTCVALTTRKKRCKRQIDFVKKLDVVALRSQIEQGTVKDVSIIYEKLELYAKRNICKNHLSRVSHLDQLVLDWADQIDQQLARQYGLMKRGQYGSFYISSLLEAVQIGIDLKQAIQPVEQPFVPWPINSHLSTDKLLNTPLQLRDSKHGIVYLYSTEDRPGLIKIGTTTATMRSRFQDYKKRCGYEAKPLWSSTIIPHARRAEQLIFSELVGYRRQEQNCPCGLAHSEWFEIDSDVAIDVAKCWCTWFEQITTYDFESKLRRGVRDEIWKLQEQHGSITGRVLMDNVEKFEALVDIEPMEAPQALLEQQSITGIFKPSKLTQIGAPHDSNTVCADSSGNGWTLYSPFVPGDDLYYGPYQHFRDMEEQWCLETSQ